MAGRLSAQRQRSAHGRPRTWFLLGMTVLAVHGCLIEHLADTVAGWSTESGMLPRLKVAYVREMSPSDAPLPPVAPLRVPQAPGPVAPPRMPRDREPVMPQAAHDSASSPESATSAPLVPGEPVAPAFDADLAMASGDAAIAPGQDSAAPQPATATSAPSVASSAAAPSIGAPASSASGPTFAWPASTRLSYRLTGQYRGEVNGSAQVEWILDAPRYQVNLDVVVGLPIAPLFTRRMRSDGRLTAAGLNPEHYEEDSKLAFRDHRRFSLQIGSQGVLLADGQRWARPLVSSPGSALAEPAVQDSASQFVQLSYLFTTQPQLLTPGASIAFPLALPRRVEPWVYEVVEAETLYTPFGPLDTFHVRPRPGSPRGRDLLAEAWFSPQLAYLPVRIRIEQDADTYIDLMIQRKPELAAR